MGEDRITVVQDGGSRRPRRRRGLLAAHVAVLASIALTSGALAGSGGAGSGGAPAAAKGAASSAAAGAGDERRGHRCHRREGRGDARSSDSFFSN